MNSKRRIAIILASVTMGSFLAFLLVRSRMGTLKPSDWAQLATNFLFAVAIVIGIGMIFRWKKKDELKKD